MNITVKKWCTN